jgi:hypothetical protein
VPVHRLRAACVKWNFKEERKNMTAQEKKLALSNVRTMRSTFFHFAVVGAIASLAVFMAQEADARGGRAGGGFRGGGSMSMARSGGFGGLSRSGAGAPQRPTGKAGERTGASSGQRPSGQTAQQSGTASNRNTGAAGNSSGNTAVAGNRTGNTGVVGSGNGNTGVVNTGDVNVGNSVNVDVDNGWGGWNGYPAGAGAAYATGVAVGTTATAAAIGSYYSTLPVGCSPYVWNSYNYYTCSGAWYRQRSQSGSTVYIVVADPTKSK